LLGDGKAGGYIHRVRISIIVPVYNVPASLLARCLKSLALQTLRADDFEIIVVDDASDDHSTLETLDRAVADVANLRKVTHSENQGLNAARRSGVHAAEGDSVIFVDGDDALTRDGAECLAMGSQGGTIDVVTAPFYRWNPERLELSKPKIFDQPFSADRVKRLEEGLSATRSMTICGRLIRRELLTDELFDLDREILHEDLVTTARLLFKCESTAHIKRPIYYYTINSMSISENLTDRHVKSVIWTLGHWRELADELKLGDKLETAMSTGTDRLLNTMTARSATSTAMSTEQREQVLAHIVAARAAFTSAEPSDGTPLLSQLMAVAGSVDSGTVEAIQAAAAAEAAANECAYGLKPTPMAQRLKDKVVFICQVDYQIRNAAAHARELRRRGIPCVILDNSRFASGGLRRLGDDERRGLFWRTEHIQIPAAPYGTDWLATARLVITFNDFNDDFREALEYRHQLDLPSVCAIEGISDFLRVDFDEPRFLPYRRCEHIFIAGEDDRASFPDRQCHLVGLPIIEQLAQTTPTFPSKPLVALNLNFTYGAMTSARPEFLSSARVAIEAAGLEWAVTVHPAEQADTSRLPVSPLTQYELIDECSVFVSRFATGIMEALAAGKPAIYFNPHGERVEKFIRPEGAFLVARTPGELRDALATTLTEIEAGVDFRERAKHFLALHTGFETDSLTSTERFADATINVIERSIESDETMLDFFCGSSALAAENRNGVVFGTYLRDQKAQVHEEELIGRYFGDRGSVLIDVGANFGNSCDIFIGKGWMVHAFEPDPNNRAVLQETWPDEERLIVNEEAVSDVAGQVVPFYASDESSGISGLSAFTEGHEQITEVVTTTLRDYYSSAGLDHVDFLKVDVEGFDKFVLDGFPWEADRPEVVLVEFEDDKTVPLGYTAHDLADSLLAQGYTVYVSEWHPIVRYGVAHDWRWLLLYDADLPLASTWGNMIGFREAPDPDELHALARRTLKFSVPGNPAAPEPRRQSSNRTVRVLTNAGRNLRGGNWRWFTSLASRIGARKTPRLHSAARSVVRSTKKRLRSRPVPTPPAAANRTESATRAEAAHLRRQFDELKDSTQTQLDDLQMRLARLQLELHDAKTTGADEADHELGSGPAQEGGGPAVALEGASTSVPESVGPQQPVPEAVESFRSAPIDGRGV
jgi:FkbM family methyltransferase